MPVLGSGPGIPSTTGNVFFVDSGATNASDGNAATGPGKPAATIEGAYDKCTADNGDIVIVMPGHTENVTAAIAIDTAGIQIIGLGIGFTRPQVVFTGTAGSFTVSAANCRISNLVLVASIAAVVNGVIVHNTIQGFELDHCHFWFDATGIEYTVMLKLGNGATDSADYVNIHDNWFEAENIDGCGSAILIDDCQFVQIRNNLFTGDYNSVCIDGAAGSSACLDYVIADNYIEQRDTGLAIDLDDSATGIAINNHAGITGALATAGFDWGNLRCSRNWVSDLADATSIIVPATLSA